MLLRRFDFIMCVMDIHTNGVQHNDIAERNVVVRADGRPCLIDFDCASEHRCDCKATIELHAKEPPIWEVGCKELHHVGHMLVVWKPSTSLLI